MEVAVAQAEKAVKALLNHEKKRSAEKALVSDGKKKNSGKDLLGDEKLELIDEETYIWLVIGFSKIPSTFNASKPIVLPLKNRVTKPDAQICLLTKDPQREFKDMVQQKNLKQITKVIGLTKLKKKYQPYEAKRNLCNSYDVFLADHRIVHLLGKPLGVKFYEKKKQPFPVDLTKTDTVKEVNKALSSTYIYLGKGSCSTIKVGRTTQSQKEILENIETVILHLKKILPQKGSTVQSIQIKTHQSIALPIYQAALPASTKIAPKGKKQKKGKKDSKKVESEENESGEENEEEEMDEE